jgi:4-hydroxy 2-oxovalerate aldolase
MIAWNVIGHPRVQIGIEVARIADAEEDVVRPAIDGECVLDRLALTTGCPDVYSSFLRHAGAAAASYGVSGTDILCPRSARPVDTEPIHRIT